MAQADSEPPLLAVCIPTFERPEFIRHQLNTLGPILAKHGVPLYVSDNSPGSETREVVESFRGQFPVHYSQNSENLRDRNFVKAVSLPDADYRWLLSDSSLFTEEQLLTVVEICSRREFDYVLLNNGKVADRTSREVSQPVELMETLGWHLTLISAFIYSRKVVDLAPQIERYFQGNFIQHAWLFELLPFHPFRVYWLGDFHLRSVPLTKTNTWTSLTYEIWTKRWTEHILSLPDSYPLAVKKRCILDHGTRSGVFGLQRIAQQRHLGALDAQVYSRYREFFGYTVRHRSWLFLMAHCPRGLAGLVEFLLHKWEKVVERIHGLVVRRS